MVIDSTSEIRVYVCVMYGVKLPRHAIPDNLINYGCIEVSD